MGRKIAILFFIVMGLGAVAYFLESPFEARFADRGEALYPKLKAEDVRAMEVEYLVRIARLEKEGDNWNLILKKSPLQEKIDAQLTEGKKDEQKTPEAASPPAEEKFAADSAKVQKAIEAVTHLKRGEPVSVNPEKQSQFELTDAAMSVTLFGKDDKQLVKLFIGKQGPNFQSTYVRDENSPEVYLVEEYLKGIFNTTQGFWEKPKDQPTAAPAEGGDAPQP